MRKRTRTDAGAATPAHSSASIYVCVCVCVLEKHGKEIAAKGEEQDTSIGEIVQAAQDEL